MKCEKCEKPISRNWGLKLCPQCMRTEPQKSEASELRQQITKCFRDTYMQTEGETELFDTEETIDALEALIRQREAEARINEVNFWHTVMQSGIALGALPTSKAIDLIKEQRLRQLKGE